MYIRTNVMALNVMNNLYAHNNQISKSMERLSTGYRINRAADDAAGLAISEKMRFQINGLNQASRNIQDGISLIQTAEGAMQEIHAMIQRMGVLANQSANGTYSDSDRAKIQLEFAQLKEEIIGIAERSNFNGIKLLNGDLSLPAKGLVIQAGSEADDQIIFNMPNVMDAVAGITGLDISTAAGARAALEALKGAVDDVSMGRAKLGAYQNRLEHRYNSVVNMSINLSAAESRIRDADMAQEMTLLIKSQMLAQVSVSLLAQANMMPRNILKLLEAL
ncbi:flagellin N-terminal helical domain-containing protein [Paenibacillus endoradicis]|uniref:flagellin N-terminal helical domain-containing protein n=1 Tax=Paenibacillus endoradicis TaxID=2972487 RepID=UPI002158FB01|nr:flagellin [Paenibacillus endoradicis]MCR8660407.1 flagellin [Paenibacillus endoradicis]